MICLERVPIRGIVSTVLPATRPRQQLRKWAEVFASHDTWISDGCDTRIARQSARTSSTRPGSLVASIITVSPAR